jgi:hypothetical protein
VLGGDAVKRRLAVTSHAVERYVERVKPMLSKRDARRELEQLASQQRLLVPAPNYITSRDHDGVIELAPGIALLVRRGQPTDHADYLGVTVETQGAHSPEYAERRRQEKRKRRRKKQAQKFRERTDRRTGIGKRPEEKYER